MTYIDTNVLVDILQGDPDWSSWSAQALLDAETPVLVSSTVYAELAAGTERQADLDKELSTLRVLLAEPNRAALFAAGRAHSAYRARGGSRERVLADFLIGAQALAEGRPLLTRDPRRYRNAFPDLRLIAPT